MKNNYVIERLTLSPLNHTWIIDLDGTVLKHNGYLIDGKDSLLPGAQEFLSGIPSGDMVIFLTSREENYKKMTESFLQEYGIRFHTIIFGAPFGERIVINDKKPSGLMGAYAINLERDKGTKIDWGISSQL